MDAIILAGGKGTRLQKVVKDVPKPLALINDIPFLDILIKKLKQNKNIGNVILSIGYKKEQIISRFKNEKNIIFSEEKIPLQTGGAIKQALTFVKSKNAIILNGDTYLDINFDDFMNFHEKKDSDITIAYKETLNANRYGSILINNKTKKILSFEEKKDIDKKGFINAGIYLFKKDIFDRVNFEKNIFSIENDFFSKFINKINMFGFDMKDSLFIDIGTKDSYLLSQKVLKDLT